jgi:glycosyltransferase involved in cell wall biosynthesis
MSAPEQRRTYRVLITVVQHYLDCAGGSSRLAYDEARYLRSLGHEVWMLAPALDEKAPEHEFFQDLHLLRYRHQKRHSVDPRRISSHQRAVVALLRRSAPASFDIIHGHSPLQYLAACELFGASARKCFSIHSPMYDEFLANARGRGLRECLRHFAGLPWTIRVERNCLTQSDWVNGFSSFTLSMMRRHHGSIADHIHVIPGWTDFDQFRIVEDRNAAKLHLGWRTDVPTLFTLRRLVPRMGLDRLIKAAGTLHRRGQEVEIVIGGNGPARESLQALALREGVREKVRFVGHVPDDDLPLLYGACDAFILPTAELECFGIIAIEALASGRPVLATPVAAIPEIMSRIEPRWMSRDASAEAIAALLADFLTGRLPAHEPQELRTIAKRFWDSKHGLAGFCKAVVGGNDVAPLQAPGVIADGAASR